MDGDVDISAVARLIGDRTRASILEELSASGALPASELARRAGVAGATASAHLAKLVAARINYSAIAYRELYLLDEARRRTEEALELSANLAFSMPRQFAGSDLLFTHLLRGDIGAAQAEWPRRWEGTSEATAWTTWLIAGRLAAARAEIALQAEPNESALEWAQRSLEIARRTHRRKYEARSLTLLGQALARLGRRDEALEALRSAVTIADELVGAPARWQARGALGDVAYEIGDDETAEAAFREAAALVSDFAANLLPERAAAVLGAEPVTHILARGGANTSAGGER